jgi:DNA-binding NtrC family response regulator
VRIDPILEMVVVAKNHRSKPETTARPTAEAGGDVFERGPCAMDAKRESLLLVADEPLVGSLTNILRGEGYGVRTFSDVEGALQCVKSENIDLVLYDIQLPGENGLEKLARLRRNSPGIPLLILTPTWNLDKAVRALEIGADNFIVSPLHFMTPAHGHALRLQIVKALEKRRSDPGTCDSKSDQCAGHEPSRCEQGGCGEDSGNGKPSAKKIKPLKKALEAPERKIILEALKACGFNRQETARALRINRTTLYNKMKKLKLLDRKSRSRV